LKKGISRIPLEMARIKSEDIKIIEKNGVPLSLKALAAQMSNLYNVPDEYDDYSL
jgi:hypothetical protein